METAQKKVPNTSSRPLLIGYFLRQATLFMVAFPFALEKNEFYDKLILRPHRLDTLLYL
jgi:hypothetical protein